MKKRMLRLISVLIVALLVTLTGCSSSASKSSTPKSSNEKAPYKIGAVLDITGGYSAIGIPQRNTLQMLVDQINKQGGVNGHQIELKILDGKSDNSENVLALKQLIEQDNVLAVIGAGTSGGCLAMVPVAMSKEVPLVALGSSVKITEPVSEHKWIFDTAQRDSQVVQKVVDYLKNHNLTNVAFMALDADFGTSGLENFKKFAEPAGVKIVTLQKFGAADTDMTSQLTKVKESKAQALVVWASTPAASYVAKGYKQLGLTIPQIQSNGIANKSFIDVAGDTANGVTFVASKLLVEQSVTATDEQTNVMKKYAADYKATYPKDKVSTFGASSNDAFGLVVNALKNLGDNPTRAEIRDQIEKTSNYNGVSGVYNLSANNHTGSDGRTLGWLTVENGKWALAKEQK